VSNARGLRRSFDYLNIRSIYLETAQRTATVNFPRPMNHIGISVTDIDVAMNWYHRILGFTVISAPVDIAINNATSIGRLLGQMYGPEMKRVKMGHMTASNGIGLEFFQFVDPPTRRQNISNQSGQKFDYTQAGFFHICITDPNPEELVKRIVETGGQQISPVLNIFPDETYQAVYCLDPFGNLVEVMSASYERTLSNRDARVTSVSSSATRAL
jgi:catechol-2,3-dioxygenase